MDKHSRIYVAGHKGLIGSAMLRLLTRQGYNNLLTCDRSSLDLGHTEAVHHFFSQHKPEYVVLAAGRTGGIVDNQRFPADYLHANLSIALNVLAAAHEHGVQRLIYFGSSCMYPRNCPQPMAEELLLSGKPEVSSMGTAISKLAGMQLCLAYNQQYGQTRFIPVIPNNTYGPNDNFNPASGHVLSSLIFRFHEAVTHGKHDIELWGSGNPRREFVHADEVAKACRILLESTINESELPINIGVGEDYSIRELAEMIAGITGFSGNIRWDTSKPDGAPQKLLDSSRMQQFRWLSSISLEEGIRNTYQWYMQHKAEQTR